MEKVSNALGYPSLKRIKNVDFRKGSVIITWSDEMLANRSECNNPELRSVTGKLKNTGKLSEELGLNVISSGAMSESKECDLGVQPYGDDVEESLSISEIL